jgi:hypothetical protein
MTRNVKLLATLLGFFVLHAGAAVKGPLRVSENGRHLQYTGGTPFFYMGDTAWELFHRLNREEAELYLRNRSAKGFNVIQAVVLAELDGITDPNPYGHLPLIEKDPTRPDEAYFAHVDWVLNKAEEVGLYVGLLPTWGKYWKRGDSQIFTPANARSFGLFLGKRYRERAIIWILGGDQNIENADERAIIDAMAQGLREGDGGAHLLTFHPRGPGQSSLQLHDAPWLDFNMTQSSHGAQDHDTGLYAERDLLRKPTKPTLDGEPRYETIPVGFYLKDHDRLKRFDDYDVRQAAYWSVLAGACGHTYGNSSIWQMWQPGRKPVLNASIPWKAALDHPGAFQMGHLRRLFEARPISKLVPDQSLVANGPLTGGAKIRAARAADGSFVIVYSPRGESFTIDKGVLPGSRVREIWFDPRYGVAHEIHATDNQGYQTYTPPTSGRGQDWVLIIEDVRAGYSPL